MSNRRSTEFVAILTTVACLHASDVRAQAARPPICVTPAAGSQPVIDVHMHAVAPAAGDGMSNTQGRMENGAVRAVIAELNQFHVAAVIVSSLQLSRALEWARYDARFIPSLAFRDTTLALDSVRTLLQHKVVIGLGELGFQYAGLSPDDPRFEKYFALAEELDVPVAIHMAGSGLPNEPGFRVRLGNPLLLEDVLIRHPRLRVNVMHAGLPFLEETIAIMRRYPLVYADLSKISDSTAYPRTQFHDYLLALMRAGLGKRLMFGSDAAGPGAMGNSIGGIMSARFLTKAQRSDILCDNAARFFRVSDRHAQ